MRKSVQKVFLHNINNMYSNNQISEFQVKHTNRNILILIFCTPHLYSGVQRFFDARAKIPFSKTLNYLLILPKFLMFHGLSDAPGPRLPKFLMTSFTHLHKEILFYGLSDVPPRLSKFLMTVLLICTENVFPMAFRMPPGWMPWARAPLAAPSARHCIRIAQTMKTIFNSRFLVVLSSQNAKIYAKFLKYS